MTEFAGDQRHRGAVREMSGDIDRGLTPGAAQWRARDAEGGGEGAESDGP